MSGIPHTKPKGKFTKYCVVCNVELKNVGYNRKYCDEHRKNYGSWSYANHFDLLKKLF